MIAGTEAVTLSALRLAMDAVALRQQALAANIANANTPGYQPVDVDFDAQLEGARLSLANEGRIDPATLAGVAPRLQPERVAGLPGAASSVQLDREVASMVQNAIRFQALSRGMGRQFAILTEAVSDGRK